MESQISYKLFAYKSPDFDKLVAFGFVKSGDVYSFVTDILNGQFKMYVYVNADGDVKTKLIDVDGEDEYTLHLTAEGTGAFVGAIRTEYERILETVAEKCFVTDVFKSDYARAAIKYVREKYGDEEEYLWQKFPSNAVWRRKDNRKWYGVLLTVSKRKLGLPSDETAEILDLRADTEKGAPVIDGKKYFPGYHMNKKTWFTVILDGSVSAEEIFGWIDRSYELAKKS
ncbi:MAG: MmcQ/YjbR family DNA-binding protein [Corallococcus sp.]|nr:MmcQ/YjbR family DNA-binding protein [Bacillota bacterium]MCM1533391.1 MmcQ/YjbR family DNA-binding protein [Corallococcus sp.]